MPDYARPSNINSARSRTYEATGLNQFLIGLDHSPSGISTDSARGPETTGNNQDDPDKRNTRRGAPLCRGTARTPRDTPVKPQARLSNVQSSHGPPDDHPLNFARSLKNREYLRVPVPSLHREVPGVAVAAQDLDGLLGDPDRGLPRDQL